MRILVVEDEKKVAAFIKRGLEEEKHEVLTATDGEEGLKLALEKGFDLIVLDWMLPKKDGLSVLNELRGKKNVTPVLMLTAKDGDYEQADAFDLGADDYLTKPFSFIVLTARLRALLRRAENLRRHCSPLRARHLFHDREEFTLVGASFDR